MSPRYNVEYILANVIGYSTAPIQSANRSLLTRFSNSLPEPEDMFDISVVLGL